VGLHRSCVETPALPEKSKAIYGKEAGERGGKVQHFDTKTREES